ncbi:unnamed protein product [Dovyalis caffra]|uniref:Uncharacterized protein n=1 Tax=Dovyalis caffra TaxID=77055 RepID=A0AAV1R1K4_9ROSI|nr:unnamed protein product [Dovyalis caffra]
MVGPCPKASSVLGLKSCDWVPKLEDVVRWLGLVLDGDISSLVLHPEFHEELKSIEGFASSLSSVAKLGCTIANFIENLRTESKEYDEGDWDCSCDDGKYVVHEPTIVSIPLVKEKVVYQSIKQAQMNIDPPYLIDPSVIDHQPTEILKHNGIVVLKETKGQLCLVIMLCL